MLYSSCLPLGLVILIVHLAICHRYEKSTRYFKMGYEADLVRFVQENVLVEVDRKIKRGQARLALNASGVCCVYIAIYLVKNHQ